MQLLPILTVLATAIAGQSFNALIIRSGSQYQYSSFKVSDSNQIVAGSGGDLNLVLNSDGSLIDTNTKKYINVGEDKSVSLLDKKQTGFSISDRDYLSYKDSSAFDVCSGGQIKFDSYSSDSSCLGVAVRAFGPQQTDDVDGSSSGSSATPSSPSSSSASLSASSSSTQEPASTTTATTETKSESQPSASAQSAAPGKKFGLVAIHSGSSVQNAGIKKVKEHPHVFAVGGTEGEFLSLAFDNDNTSLVDQDGRGINLDQNTGELGDVAPFGRQPATTGFAVQDGHLTYNGNSGWKACPSGGDKFSLSNKECTGGIDIALKVVYA